MAHTAALVVASATACGGDSPPSEPPPLLSASVVHVPLSRIDGVPWVRVELELQTESICEEPDHPALYGIYLDADLGLDTIAEDPLFGVLDPQLQISAQCEDGELVSAAGSVTVEPGPVEGTTLVTIDARSEELPLQFHWVAFAVGRESVQLAPPSGAEVSRISDIQPAQ